MPAAVSWLRLLCRLYPTGRRDRPPLQQGSECARGDVVSPPLGAPGTNDRLRRGRLDGEEEARGVLLMAAIPEEIEASLAVRERKKLVRVVAIVSVDDGNSTLIGRLLYATGGLYADPIVQVK